MKKTLIISSIVIVVFIVAFIAVLRFPPWALGSALSVATGLSAKLGCSHYFVSGFSPAQITEDLATYSPATRLVDVTYDDANRQVSAEIFGMRNISATYRPGLGCSFDHPQSLALDSVSVKTAPDTSAPWPQGNQVNTIVTVAQNRLDKALQQDNAEGQDTRALLVIQNGKVIAESYAEGINADTMLLGWSMGKSITAMLIGSLLQDGKLSLDENALYKPWSNDERRDISIHHLLTMTDGLNFDETYTPGSDSTKMLFGAPSAADVAMDSPLAHDAGRHFYYSSGTTNLLAKLVYERAGNSPQANYDYFYHKMLAPMGLANTLFETDSSGAFVGSSYIYATARDWAKFGYLLVNEGEINAHRILSEGFVKRLGQPNESENDQAYGYQVWLNAGNEKLNWPELPKDAYAMRGNRGQIVLVVPSTETVIVRLGWSSVWYPLEEKMAPIFKDIANN